MPTFGERIEAGRKAKNISKSELARRAGITPQYVTDIETNRMIPSEEKISKLQKLVEMLLSPGFGGPDIHCAYSSGKKVL